MQDLRNFFRQAARNPENYRVKPADFTRKGKLHFSKLTGLMLSLLKSHCSASCTKFLPRAHLAPNLLSVKPEKN